MRAYKACKALSTARGEAHYLADTPGHHGDPSGHPTVTVTVTALTEVHEKCGRKAGGGVAFAAVADALHRARMCELDRFLQILHLEHFTPRAAEIRPLDHNYLRE